MVFITGQGPTHSPFHAELKEHMYEMTAESLVWKANAHDMLSSDS